MKVDLSIKWINLFTARSQLFGFVTVKTKVCENDFHKCQIDLFKSTIDFRLIHQSWVLIFCEKSVFFSFQSPKPTTFSRNRQDKLRPRRFFEDGRETLDW